MNMSCYFLRVAQKHPLRLDVIPGTSLADAEDQAAALVLFLNHPVVFDFNGRDVLIDAKVAPGLITALVTRAFQPK